MAAGKSLRKPEWGSSDVRSQKSELNAESTISLLHPLNPHLVSISLYDSDL